MNQTDETLKLVADLKPAAIDRLADEGYSRRRHDDLARALASAHPRASAAGSRGLLPRHGRRWRPLVLGIALTGAAAGLVVGLVVQPASTQHLAVPLAPRLTAAQRVIYRLSAATVTVPEPAGRYVALTEIDSGPALGDAKNQRNLKRALAIMKKVPALRKDYVATLKKLRGMPSVLTFQRTSVIDSLTGDTWTYQRGGDVPGELPVARHGSPTKAQFAGWPTGVPALRDLLLTQAHKQVADHVQVSGQTSDDLVFEQASNWLWNPLISPALRSALYKVLAATPGVMVKVGTTDRTGRPAIEISRFNTITKESSATFENPRTGAVLESLDDQTDSAVYQSITSYDSPPANPYAG